MLRYCRYPPEGLDLSLRVVDSVSVGCCGNIFFCWTSMVLTTIIMAVLVLSVHTREY